MRKRKKKRSSVLWERTAGFPPPHEYAIGSGSAAGFQRAGMRLGGRQRQGLHDNERGSERPPGSGLRDGAAPAAGPGFAAAAVPGHGRLSPRGPGARTGGSGRFRRALGPGADDAGRRQSGAAPGFLGSGSGTVFAGALPKSVELGKAGGRKCLLAGTAVALGWEVMVTAF